MKITPPLLRRAWRTTVIATTISLIAGCWKDSVIWSPDGNHAAIITTDGLHLCDASGKLSPLLAPGVDRAAWLPDSQRLVLATTREIKEYSALTAALGPERTRSLAAKSEAIWQLWLATPNGADFNPPLAADDVGAVMVYLRAHHHDETLAKVKEKDRADFEAAGANWHSLVVARITGDKLECGPTLSDGLATIEDIRPTPSGLAVAFVTNAELSPENDAGLQLHVVPTDGSTPASLLSTQVGAHPDWTPDSRTIVYLQAEGGHFSGKPDDLRLGALVERRVLDEHGHVVLGKDSNPRELAGLIFQTENRVRCLRDGRVLFDAAEFRLPLAGSDRSTREQLFALDRTKEKPALVPLIPAPELGRMPNPLAFFEVNAIETEVLFGGGGDVPVLRLADGHVEHHAVPLVDNSNDKNPPLPRWRLAGEFSYLKKTSGRNELVLWRGDQETSLSQTWPDEVLRKLIE